jgi:multidrug resistance protein, MATE family
MNTGAVAADDVEIRKGRARVVTAPRLSQLLALALPIVVTRASQVVIGLSDALMVAHLGTAALAATTAGAFNVYTLLIFPMGIAFVVASFSSQMTGAGDHAGARRYGYYGLVIAGVCGVAALFVIPLASWGLGFFGYASDVHALMSDYLRWRLYSVGFVVGLEALGSYFGGVGNTRLPMFAQLLAMVLNVLLNWLLIGGHWGAPALGVAGAALASSIASLAAFAVLFISFLRAGSRSGNRMGLQARELWHTLRVGIPSGLNWFLEFAAFACFINVVLTSLGTTAVAAMMSIFQVNKVAYLPAFAIACAGSIFVGQAVGAKAHSDVPRTVRLTLATAATWQGLIAIPYLIIPGVLMSVFARGDADGRAFLNVAVPMLTLSAAWQLFDAACMTFTEVLRAVGDTAFTFWVRALTAWGVFVPGAWVSVHVFGAGHLVAIGWLGLYYALFSGILWLRFRSGHWRRLDLAGVSGTLRE